MDNRTVVGALSIQLNAACILCTLIYWFSQSELGRIGPYPLVLLAYGPLLYGLDRLFLRRERTLRDLVLLNAGAGLAFFAVLVPLVGWGRWGSLIFAGLACLWLTVQAAQLSLSPPAMSKMILFLDGSLVLLLLFTAYGAAVQVPAFQFLPACVGCAASLLGLMLRRLGGGLGAKGWGFIAGAFLAVLALVCLLVGFAAAPAGQGVVVLWNTLAAAVQFILSLLWQLLVWLSSLIPAPETVGELEPPLQAELPEAQEPMAQSNPVLVALTAALAIAGAVFLLVLALRALGRLRVGGRTAVVRVRASRRRVSLLKGLARLIAALAGGLRLRMYLFRIRNTPEGLFYLLVRRCRTAPWHKRRGETPREFLLRLRSSAQTDPELASALDGLIPAVDRALYAPKEKPALFPQARLVRRRVGASVRRQFLREGLYRVKKRLPSGG